jgi:pimeloyl-ACP methyl ester carboxylesterase
VVLAAAESARPDFVITNSGPAVTPREQETYSTAQRSGMAAFAAVLDAVSRPFDAAWPQLRDLPMVSELVAAGAFVPDHADLWAFTASIVDHDPRASLERLDVPLLALLGADDDMVPVQRSAAVFRSAVRPELLELRIVPGGDHRFQVAGEFVSGYLDALIGFVIARLG